MRTLTTKERIHLECVRPFRHWVGKMLSESSTGLKFAIEPLLTDKQRYLSEFLPQSEIVSDCDDPEPHLICPKCKCHSPQFSGGDSIMHVRSGMVHYTFWTCLNPDCNHWWMLEDDYE